MTTPVSNINRTNLNALDPNLATGQVADPALRKACFDEIYNYFDTFVASYNAFIANGGIATANIADLAVTTAKLALLSVTAAQIANGTITTTQIADGTLMDADVNPAAAIAWTKISKASSSLADLVSRLASDLTGTLNAAQMPALTGDITTLVGTIATTLKNTGTAGTYKSVTTDAQGRVTAGTNPTTLAGYGITDAAPSSHVGTGGTAHANVIAGGAAGFMMGTDKTKLDGISAGAEVNQNTFSIISVAGQSDVVADQKSDALTLVSGTGITVTTDATTDTITITATGAALPGAHASTHVTGGTDVIANAVAGGNAGLMSGADKTQVDLVAPHLSDTLKHRQASGTTQTGTYANAEGSGTKATGDYSHAEGYNTTASGTYSHAEGYGTVAGSTGTISSVYTVPAGYFSHAEGNGTNASGGNAHAEGKLTIASGDASHAEGFTTTASSDSSHAEGSNTIASAYTAHAEGYATTASGTYSHSQNLNTRANVYASTTMGQNSKLLTGNAASYSSTADALVIGNGTNSSTFGNAFRVTFDGKTYGLSAYNSTGADYAEFFEWEDGNINEEERVGFFVTLDGEKIRKATSTDDYILGIVSVNPSVVGDNHADDWSGKYIKDIWGRIQYHNVVVPAVYEEEILVTEERTDYVPILNPNWDSSQSYTPREERKEWDMVGMLGKLLCRDDSTCQVNGFCKPNDNGMATASATGYKVMKRISANIIQVLLK